MTVNTVEIRKVLQRAYQYSPTINERNIIEVCELLVRSVDDLQNQINELENYLQGNGILP